MGYPLRSKIFRPDTYEHRNFSRFPLQVTVLFTAQEGAFSDTFRHQFAQLDQFTGDDVAFFAVLDPPEDRVTLAHARGWWQAYQLRTGQSSFTYSDDILVQEIARLFSVKPSQLPVSAVSPNLWNGEHLIANTGSTLLAPQLRALTSLVQALGRPTIRQIRETLRKISGMEPVYRPEDKRLQDRLRDLDDVVGKQLEFIATT